MLPARRAPAFVKASPAAAAPRAPRRRPACCSTSPGTSCSSPSCSWACRSRRSPWRSGRSAGCGNCGGGMRAAALPDRNGQGRSARRGPGLSKAGEAGHARRRPLPTGAAPNRESAFVAGRPERSDARRPMPQRPMAFAPQSPSVVRDPRRRSAPATVCGVAPPCVGRRLRSGGPTPNADCRKGSAKTGNASRHSRIR